MNKYLVVYITDKREEITIEADDYEFGHESEMYFTVDTKTIAWFKNVVCLIVIKS